MGLPNFWIKFCIKKVFALEEQVLSKKKKKRKNYEKEFQSCYTQLCISTGRYLQIFSNMYNWYQTPFVLYCLFKDIYLLDRSQKVYCYFTMVFIRKLNILRRNVKKRIELDAQCKRILIWRRIAKLGAIFLNTKKCFEETI